MLLVKLQGLCSTCTIDKRESIPSNEEARTGTPITGKGVSEATIPKIQTNAYLGPIRHLMMQ